MAYIDGSRLMADQDLRSRIAQCARLEKIDDADAWALKHMGDFASQPGWSDAWASAEQARSSTIGADGSVITDAQILAAVRSISKGTEGSGDGAGES